MTLRILVVDDDQFMRDMLPPLLRSEFGPGAVTEAVGTPTEASRKLAPHADGERLVVLSDYNLKTTQDGLDVLAHVARTRPDAVRVLFSGHTRQEIQGIDRADIHGFIEKPFRLRDLLPAVRAIVDRNFPAGQAEAPAPVRVDGALRLEDAARELPHEEIVPALVRAATKGEEGRARTLYAEAERRGQHPAAEREATRALVWQNRVLELVAAGVPLADTLSVLARVVEEQAPGLLASVLLLDESGKRLLHGAAPSLPASYVSAIDGVRVGEGGGSCGMAAHVRRPIIVVDTQTDPLWADYRDLAREHGLAACWSTPILTPAGRLLGTFALYHRESRAPDEREAQLIELGANLARLVIESHQSREAVRTSESRYRTLFNSIDQGFCVIELIDGPGGEDAPPVDYRSSR